MTAAKGTAVTPDIEPGADPTVAPADWNFELVHEGTATVVIFENIGDEFVGQYLTEEHIEREPNAKGEDQSFNRYIFLGRDGEQYALNKSYALAEAIENAVSHGEWCKIRYTKDVKTSRGQNDMKDFKVYVRR